MRVALPLLAVCAALAACTSQPNRVSSTPPSVSYRIAGNNVAATSAEAQDYCTRYGRAAQYRGVQNAAEGAVAVYTCDGVSEPPVAPSGGTVPPGTVGAPTVIVPRQ